MWKLSLPQNYIKNQQLTTLALLSKHYISYSFCMLYSQAIQYHNHLISINLKEILIIIHQSYKDTSKPINLPFIESNPIMSIPTLKHG